MTESAGGITVSQSLGVDPSVDSLALEDYDHIEPVERLSWGEWLIDCRMYGSSWG